MWGPCVDLGLLLLLIQKLYSFQKGWRVCAAAKKARVFGDRQHSAMRRNAPSVAAAKAPAPAPATTAAGTKIAGSKKTTKRKAFVFRGSEDGDAESSLMTTSAPPRKKKKVRGQGRRQEQQEKQQQQQHKRQELAVGDASEGFSTAGNSPLAAACEPSLAAGHGAPSPAQGAATAAATPEAATDPYLLADAEYLRTEKRWLNRQRTLLLGSRGISARSRHLIEDLKRLLPHHKSEVNH